MLNDTAPSDRTDPTARRGRSRLLTRDRHVRILDQLSTMGSVSVSSLATELDVSDMTIRRDLVELEREGRLVRIHGGALPTESLPPVAMDSEEPSFESRLHQRREAKLAIARLAAEIISRYRAIAIDVGTTTYLLASQLRHLQHAKIFTNSLRIATLLDGAGPDVYIAGGQLRSDELSICGPSAIAQFEALWFDVAVIGVSGVTAEGLFDYSFEEADMKRVYLRRSALKIALCDSAKFQRMSLVNVAPLADIDILITDAEPPAKIAAVLAASGVELRVAGSSAAS